MGNVFLTHGWESGYKCAGGISGHVACVGFTIRHCLFCVVCLGMAPSGEDNCGRQEEPAILISTLLLQSCVVWPRLDFCSIRESSTRHIWTAKNAIFSRASCVIWTLDHVKLTHSSSANQSKSSMSMCDSSFPFMSRWVSFPGRIPSQASSKGVVRLFVVDLNRRARVVFGRPLLQAWSVGVVRP